MCKYKKENYDYLLFHCPEITTVTRIVYLICGFQCKINKQALCLKIKNFKTMTAEHLIKYRAVLSMRPYKEVTSP